MSWKTLCQMDLHGKRVLTRVDLNVPIVDGKITDATRIKKIVPTVNEIIKTSQNHHEKCIIFRSRFFVKIRQQHYF